MLLVCIEGGIGYGKTTLINTLKQLSDHEFMVENLDSWGDLLDKFYSDTKTNSLAFQLLTLSTWFESLTKIWHKKVVITERSHTTNRSFKTINYFKRTDAISEINEKTYEIMQNTITHLLPNILYIRFSRLELSVQKDRILRRARACEKDIPDSYHIALEDQMDKELEGKNVIYIDPNADIVENCKFILNEIDKYAVH
jgi:deoxyadenosine/deoxycytidine kinase